MGLNNLPLGKIRKLGIRIQSGKEWEINKLLVTIPGIIPHLLFFLWLFLRIFFWVLFKLLFIIVELRLHS